MGRKAKGKGRKGEGGGEKEEGQLFFLFKKNLLAFTIFITVRAVINRQFCVCFWEVF